MTTSVSGGKLAEAGARLTEKQRPDAQAQPAAQVQPAVAEAPKTTPAAEIEPPARLGSLESQVMEILWDTGPRTIRQIMDEIPSDPAYTTIATVLGNLERKGFATPSRTGRTVRFLPRFTKAEHCADLMEYALSTSCNRAESIMRFVDSMSDSERAILFDYLKVKAANEAR